MTDLFPLVACCGGEQLAFVELLGDDLVHVCSSCGTQAPIARAVDDSILSAFGLRVREGDPVENRAAKKTGCSSGKCGSKAGGCSTGSCGTCSSGC